MQDGEMASNAEREGVQTFPLVGFDSCLSAVELPDSSAVAELWQVQEGVSRLKALISRRTKCIVSPATQDRMHILSGRIERMLQGIPLFC